MQAVYGFDEGEGFARAGFHQHVQVERGRGGGCHGHRAGVDLVAGADAFNVGLQGFVLGVWQVHRIGLHVAGGGKVDVGQHIGNALHRLRLVRQTHVLELDVGHTVVELRCIL